MAVDLPDVNQLARDFFNGLRARRGDSIQYERLKVWDGWASGLSRLALRAILISGRRFDAAFLDRAGNGQTTIPNDLDDYCTARGPVRRFAKKAAIGTLTFARPTAGAGSGTILKGTEVRFAYKGTSYTYTTDLDLSIASTQLSIDVPCTASVAGAASNADGGGTVGLTLTGNGPAMFDATLKPSAISLSGGADDETNDELRERQRLWEQARERATDAAIAFGARLVNGVKRVVVAKAFDTRIGGYGYVYVGDVNWMATQSLKDAVAASLERWRGLTATPVSGFTTVDVVVNATLLMARPVALYDVTALKVAATAEILRYFNSRLDAYAYDITTLKGRIGRVHDEIAAVTLTSPTVSVQSPISPSALKASGGLPSRLTRYRATSANVLLDVVGPS